MIVVWIVLRFCLIVSCVVCAGGVSMLVVKPELWKMVCFMRRCGCGCRVRVCSGWVGFCVFCLRCEA